MKKILSLKSMNFTEEQLQFVKQLLLEKEKEIDILKRDLQEANKEKEKLLKRLNLKTYIIKKTSIRNIWSKIRIKQKKQR